MTNSNLDTNWKLHIKIWKMKWKMIMAYGTKMHVYHVCSNEFVHDWFGNRLLSFFIFKQEKESPPCVRNDWSIFPRTITT